MLQPLYRFIHRANKTHEAELTTGESPDWIEYLQVDPQYLYVNGKRFPLKLLDQLRSVDRSKVAQA